MAAIAAGGATDVRARRRGDVGRAGESGPHVRHFFIEHDDHFEVRGLLCCGLLARRLDGAVADLGDMALENPIGNRVDGDLRRLPKDHVGNIRLVDFDLSLND